MVLAAVRCFRRQLILHDASGQAPLELFVHVPLQPSALFVVSGNLCSQLCMLGYLNVAVVLHFLVQQMERGVVTYHACIP